MRKFYTLLVALVTAFAATATDWCLAGEMTNNWQDVESYKFTYNESDGLYHLTLDIIEANKQFKLKEWGNWNTNRSYDNLKNKLQVIGFDNFDVDNVKGENGNNIYLDVTVENVELIFDGEYSLTFKNAASDDVIDYNEVTTSSFSWTADVEEGKYVAYFKNPKNWEQIYAYAWDDKGTFCKAWPGVATEKVGRYYKWTYEGDVTPNKIIYFQQR